jgi:hypothetical protein
VLSAEVVINTRSDEVLVERNLRDVVESEKERVAEGDILRADLIAALVVGKKEEPVFFYRPAERGTVLPAHEEGVFETFARFRVAA